MNFGDHTETICFKQRNFDRPEPKSYTLFFIFNKLDISKPFKTSFVNQLKKYKLIEINFLFLGLPIRTYLSNGFICMIMPL